MKFLHFGQSPRALFGAFQSPQLAAGSTAVLLCNPFGEEAVRAHRIYRVLSTQLARAGHAVLRFDWYGTGDSSGDATEATLDDWLADVRQATVELRRESGATRVVMLGLRLGGTLAALASESVGVDHLVLWDPIVDGQAYLRELGESHAEYMTDEFGEPQPPPRMSADGYPEEALGHPLSPVLAKAIAAIDLSRANVRANAITVVSTKTSPELARLESSLPSARWIQTSTSVPWNSDAAVNNAVVPMDVLKILITAIGDSPKPRGDA